MSRMETKNPLLPHPSHETCRPYLAFDLSVGCSLAGLHRGCRDGPAHHGGSSVGRHEQGQRRPHHGGATDADFGPAHLLRVDDPPRGGPRLAAIHSGAKNRSHGSFHQIDHPQLQREIHSRRTSRDQIPQGYQSRRRQGRDSDHHSLQRQPLQRHLPFGGPRQVAGHRYSRRGCQFRGQLPRPVRCLGQKGRCCCRA